MRSTEGSFMSILIGALEFDGPFEDIDSLSDASGIYAVLCENDGELELVEIADAEVVREEIQQHRIEHSGLPKGSKSHSPSITPPILRSLSVGRSKMPLTENSGLKRLDDDRAEKHCGRCWRRLGYRATAQILRAESHTNEPSNSLSILSELIAATSQLHCFLLEVSMQCRERISPRARTIAGSDRSCDFSYQPSPRSPTLVPAKLRVIK